MEGFQRLKETTHSVFRSSRGSRRLQNHIPLPAAFGPSPLPLSWKWRCRAHPSGSQGPLRGRADTPKSPGMVSQASRCVCVWGVGGVCLLQTTHCRYQLLMVTHPISSTSSPIIFIIDCLYTEPCHQELHWRGSVVQREC